MVLFGYSADWLSAHDIWILATALLVLLMVFDDIFVSILAFFIDAKPKKISREQFNMMNALDQKKIAIMIANWHEEDVLERMVRGNMANIDYLNYDIFLGVYKNDLPTLSAANKVAQQFKNVKIVINSLYGPTSKGQMINEIVNFVNEHNTMAADPTSQLTPYDIFLTHDAEDVIHKYSLKLINLKSREYDFIQIPVFSFKVPKSKLVAGIYMDEFSESHTQNLIVRDRFKAGVPSAGVGTAVSRSAIAHLIKAQGGYFLNENTLTEDYYLGLTCYDLNIKAHFAAEYFEERDAFRKGNVKDYIATREYFPTQVSTSVRQKTRWIMGICLQSYEQKKRKSSNIFGSYFLWRDRKSLWAAPIFISSVVFLTYYTITFFIEGRWPHLDYLPYQKVLNGIIVANFVFSIWNVLRRMVLVSRVYDKTIALMVPVRWITSYYVNNVATFNAIYLWVRSKIKGQLPKWSKTDHIIPVGFGMANFKFVESEAAIPASAPVRIENEL